MVYVKAKKRRKRSLNKTGPRDASRSSPLFPWPAVVLPCVYCLAFRPGKKGRPSSPARPCARPYAAFRSRFASLSAGSSVAGFVWLSSLRLPALRSASANAAACAAVFTRRTASRSAGCGRRGAAAFAESTLRLLSFALHAAARVAFRSAVTPGTSASPVRG